MIICSACGAQSSAVTDSRVRDDGCVRRRRKCEECGHKWTTVEVNLENFKTSLDGDSINAMRSAHRALKVAFHRLNRVDLFAQEHTVRPSKPYKPRDRKVAQ